MPEICRDAFLIIRQLESRRGEMYRPFERDDLVRILDDRTAKDFLGLRSGDYDFTHPVLKEPDPFQGRSRLWWFFASRWWIIMHHGISAHVRCPMWRHRVCVGLGRHLMTPKEQANWSTFIARLRNRKKAFMGRITNG